MEWLKKHWYIPVAAVVGIILIYLIYKSKSAVQPAVQPAGVLMETVAPTATAPTAAVSNIAPLVMAPNIANPGTMLSLVPSSYPIPTTQMLTQINENNMAFSAQNEQENTQYVQNLLQEQMKTEQNNLMYNFMNKML